MRRPTPVGARLHRCSGGPCSAGCWLRCFLLGMPGCVDADRCSGRAARPALLLPSTGGRIVWAALLGAAVLAWGLAHGASQMDVVVRPGRPREKKRTNRWRVRCRRQGVGTAGSKAPGLKRNVRACLGGVVVACPPLSPPHRRPLCPPTRAALLAIQRVGRTRAAKCEQYGG